MQIFKSDILNISTYSKKNGMKIIYIRDWVFIMIFSLIAVLYSLLFGRTMTAFLSLIKMGDIIPYNKTCALIGSIPLIGYIPLYFKMDIKSCKIHSQ